MRDRELVRRACRLGVPEDLAGLGVDGEQVRVDGAHEERVAEDGQSAAHAAAARAGLRRGLVLERPEGAAGDGVERDDLIRALHGRALQRVEHAVHRQRGRLELLQRPGLPDPLQLQVLHVGRRDLRELAVALVEDRSRVAQPVLRLLVGAKQAVERHLLSEQGATQDNHKGHKERTRKPKSFVRVFGLCGSASRAVAIVGHGFTLPFNDTR